MTDLLLEVSMGWIHNWTKKFWEVKTQCLKTWSLLHNCGSFYRVFETKLQFSILQNFFCYKFSNTEFQKKLSSCETWRDVHPISFSFESEDVLRSKLSGRGISLFVLGLCQELFVQSTSNTAGVLLQFGSEWINKQENSADVGGAYMSAITPAAETCRIFDLLLIFMFGLKRQREVSMLKSRWIDRSIKGPHMSGFVYESRT